MQAYSFLPVLALSAAACAAPVLHPWQIEGASHRQVIEARSAVARQNAVVEFVSAAPAGAPLRVVDAAVPAAALPVFRAGERLLVPVPGEWTAARQLAVYWSEEGGIDPSPLLPAQPIGGDDYATATHGHAWDFADGSQSGIRSWGDGPQHYGTITVEDGILTIPVTGPDPYCIWGVMFGEPGDQPGERIDSARYTRLRLRVRQSCPTAEWSLFFTDEKGQYQPHNFTVRGSEFQILEFDLPKIFPGFWDGRIMRAFRIDPTNKRPDTTVQIDWVRLELPDPTVEAGPVFTRADVAGREAVRRYDLTMPAVAVAGETLAFRPVLAGGAPIFAAELRDGGGRLAARAADHAGVVLPAGEQARPLAWTFGPADDLGRPASPLETGAVEVRPAALDHYVLEPERRFVPTKGNRQVRIRVAGADRFGNNLPVVTGAPRVTIANGGRVEWTDNVLAVTCSDQPLVAHTVGFTDENNITGSCVVRTVGHRQTAIGYTPTGYITVNGELFLPLGGFYANWPSGRPGADDKIGRSLDLFPCNPVPYPHGFPWPADVEEKVCTYLDLCRENGVTALRLMLRNMDIVGRVDPVQLQATLHLFDLGFERGLRFSVALHEDYNKPPYVNRDIVEKICLPHYTAEELAALPPHRARFLVRKDILETPAARYLDADAIRCQKEYLDELIPVLAGHEAVLRYEFENEMVNPPMSWCREIAAHIRTIDPRTPILGNPGPHYWPEPWRWRDSSIHQFSYHPYNNGMERADHGTVVFARSKWAAAAGFPFATGEGGINQNRWQPDVPKVPNEFSMRGIRDQIWLSLACGANGSFMWTADCGAEMAEFGKVRPALAALGIDLAGLKRRTPRVVVVMPDNAKANNSACELAGNLLARGIDFDVRPAAAAAGYTVRLDGADPKVPDGLEAEFFAPAEGWQIASLVAADGSQALVYLRNVAGGIRNYGGEARPCWLRTPGQTPAGLRIRAGEWTQIRAFSLDRGEIVPVERNADGILLPAGLFDDMVIGLVRRKDF